MSIINGQILLLGAVLVAAIWFARNSRRARLAAAKAAHPSNRAHQPAPTRQTCAVTGCAYPAFWIVTRRGFNTTERVCTGCYHEGDAFGWWK